MRRTRRLGAGLLLALAGIAGALAVGEAALRITGLGRPGLYVYDHFRGWGLRPGAREWRTREGRALVEVNRFGFRGPARALVKPAGVFRIAVLGDSFTEANQVAYDQTFTAVMERNLGACRALSGRAVEVLNFGVDSYGTAQELLTLRHQAARFSPDAVVLAVFTGNDIRNNSAVLEGDRCRPFYVFRNGALAPGGPFIESPAFRLNCRLRFESRRLAVLNVLGSIHGVIMRLKRRLKGRPASPATSRAAGRAEQPGIDLGAYRPPTSPAWQDAWKVTEGVIELADAEAERGGSRFYVVTLATPLQDDPDPASLEQFIRRFGIADPFYPDRRIKALGERAGFPVLNLAPALARYAATHHVFLHGFANTRPGIGHWNAEGHRVAGELIAGWLCGNLVGGGDPHPGNWAR